MRYKLGKTIWELVPGYSDTYQCPDIDLGGTHLTPSELRLMGATPIEDEELEELDELGAIKNPEHMEIVSNRIQIDRLTRAVNKLIQTHKRK